LILGGKPPSSRYQKSPCEFTGKLLTPEYDSEDTVKRVQKKNGLFRFRKKRYHAGKGLSGQDIAIRSTDADNEFSIFFMDSLIKTFKLEDNCE
jgi:hypothetical protein